MKWAGAIVAGLAALVLLILLAAHGQHWLAVHTGTVNESGPYYGFWSGFGSDLGEVTLVGTIGVGVYTGVRKANCHEPGCWRIGHYPLEGTPHHLCARHHPHIEHDTVTHDGIIRRHEAAIAARERTP